MKILARYELATLKQFTYHAMPKIKINKFYLS